MIVGDFNCDIMRNPVLAARLSTNAILDLGLLWPARHQKPPLDTCRPSITSAGTRRDYVSSCPQLLSLVKNFEVTEGIFPTHAALRVQLTPAHLGAYAYRLRGPRPLASLHPNQDALPTSPYALSIHSVFQHMDVQFHANQSKLQALLGANQGQQFITAWATIVEEAHLDHHHCPCLHCKARLAVDLAAPPAHPYEVQDRLAYQGRADVDINKQRLHAGVPFPHKGLRAANTQHCKQLIGLPQIAAAQILRLEHLLACIQARRRDQPDLAWKGYPHHTRQTDALHLFVTVDQCRPELCVTGPYRVASLRGGTLNFTYLANWIQVALLPQYRYREDMLIVQQIAQTRAQQRERNKDKTLGLTHAYRSLRGAPEQRLVFLKRTDGQFASTPQEVDELFITK